uniref:Uncharacterized protein n=1 Tax=Leersia perrieri TaxID=77586 RepID=A0A0D9WJ14_9ORYZ
MTKSVSSVVESSKKTNRILLPIRLPDPPRSHKATTSATPAETQKVATPRAADSGSKTTTNVQLEISKSLIDFDSDFEPHKVGSQTEVQKIPPLPDVGWATFDDTTPKKATAISISSTNSLEGVPYSVSALQSSFGTRQNTKSLSFPHANHGSQQNQLFSPPANNIQSFNPPLNRATSAPVNSQWWGAASQASTQGSQALPSNHGFAGTLASQKPAVDTTSSRGQALPEDISTMSYRPLYAATWDWRANPQLNMGYGQYSMQYPVRAANFPSLSSMQGALPDMGSTTLWPHVPFVGAVNSSLTTLHVPQPMKTNNNQFMVERAANVAYQMQNNSSPIGYQGVQGLATTGNAYGLSSVNQPMAVRNMQGITQSSLPQVGGNPFA